MEDMQKTIVTTRRWALEEISRRFGTDEAIQAGQHLHWSSQVSGTFQIP